MFGMQLVEAILTSFLDQIASQKLLMAELQFQDFQEVKLVSKSSILSTLRTPHLGLLCIDTTDAVSCFVQESTTQIEKTSPFSTFGFVTVS